LIIVSRSWHCFQQVATTQPIVCAPTAATGRRVTLSLGGVLVCVSVVGVASLLPGTPSVWCGSLGLTGALFLLAVIAQQPQNHQKAEGRVPLVPWVPASVVLINLVLGSHLVVTVWPAVVIWMLLGVSNISCSEMNMPKGLTVQNEVASMYKYF
jgi:hypothetical protein